jgi:lipopolysaccharide/colanic/teichoic acid biosynthesis glycosyltransferase
MSSTSSTFSSREFDQNFLEKAGWAASGDALTRAGQSPTLTDQAQALLLDQAQALLSGRAHSAKCLMYLASKRCLDIVVASLALILLSPIFLVVALLIKFRDGGPIFFVQKRVGKGGRLFDFYKFRSMVVGAERKRADLLLMNDHESSITFKMRKDPRITWIGRIIRKTSIDEMPQFLNVLRGEMTLVGPRPALPCEVDQYTEEDRQRLIVTPGLTCLWQISGRANLPFQEQVRLDVQYIREQSLLLDLHILARTIPAVLSGRGAY